MPIKLKNLDAGLGVVFIGEGIVTGEEIIRANRTVLSFGKKIRASKYCIIDYSNATKYDVSTSEIEVIATQDKEISEYVPEYLVAIVAKKNLEFGVSRMWETVVEAKGLKWETMVFKDRDDAEEWIKRKVSEKYNIDLTLA
jgi:hypothetical protein